MLVRHKNRTRVDRKNLYSCTYYKLFCRIRTVICHPLILKMNFFVILLTLLIKWFMLPVINYLEILKLSLSAVSVKTLFSAFDEQFGNRGPSPLRRFVLTLFRNQKLWEMKGCLERL